MSFRSPLDLRTLASHQIAENLDRVSRTRRRDERSWVLLHDIEYEVGDLGSGKVVVVPEGFVTDLASVPRVLWALIPPFGRHASAAVVHDYLYSIQFHTRKDADKIFHEAMVVSGTPRIRARLMYLAVRAFGYPAWRK